MRQVPVPLVLGVDLDPGSVKHSVYNTTDTKIMRIGPIHMGMRIAAYAVPEGSSQTSLSKDQELFVGVVQDKRRVTLFGFEDDYIGQDIIIRVRGKSEVTGNHVLPFQTTISGTDICAAAKAKNRGDKRGMVGTIVRTIIQEDPIHGIEGEDWSKADQQSAEQFNRIVDAATGVTMDDYAALGEFIVEMRKRRH